MITKGQIQQLKDKIGNDGEMLTVYAHVNPAHPNNHPKAITLRARETLKSLGMTKELIDAVLAHLATETKAARTVAIFAHSNGFEVVEMAVDLPVVDPTTGHIEARWGAPHLAPLLLALDEHERYGVVFIDQERWRFFEVFIGEIEEVAQVFHPLSPQEMLRMDEMRQLTPELLDFRDDLLKAGSARHVLAWTHRFYKDVAHRIDVLVNARGIDRLILMGPDREVHFLETLLPRPMRERVVAKLPSLSSPNAAAHEVLQRVEPSIGVIESQKELELLDHIRERGVWGLAETLSALQNGQLFAVVAPWRSKHEVFVESNTGFVTTSERDARAFAGPNGKVEKRMLHDILPELAMSFAARVELVQGHALGPLERDFGGLAGLRRWARNVTMPKNGRVESQRVGPQY